MIETNKMNTIRAGRLTIFSLVLAFTTLRSFAWGPEGHKMVADVAKLYLDKGVEEKVQKYLGTMTFEDASVWMDEIKKDHAYDYMKSWHYINIDKDKTYVKTEEPNVVNELVKSIALLGNLKALKDDEIDTNIKIVFHLTGDLHMPLHVGYGNDRGGNDEKVDFMGKQKNLHYVWDMAIIEYKHISLDDCVKAGAAYSKADIKELQKIDVVKWMEESRSLLKDVYDYKDGMITEEYITKNTPVIEKQIFIAGLRLAAILNQTFKK
jgi:hypothetical protein